MPDAKLGDVGSSPAVVAYYLIRVTSKKRGGFSNGSIYGDVMELVYIRVLETRF